MKKIGYLKNGRLELQADNGSIILEHNNEKVLKYLVEKLKKYIGKDWKIIGNISIPEKIETSCIDYKEKGISDRAGYGSITDSVGTDYVLDCQNPDNQGMITNCGNCKSYKPKIN